MELYTKMWFCARYFALLAYQPFEVLQVYANWTSIPSVLSFASLVVEERKTKDPGFD